MEISSVANELRTSRRKNKLIVAETSSGDSSLQRGFQDLSLSTNLVTNISQKLKNKSLIKQAGMEEKIERRPGIGLGISSGCIGGGCKVGVDTVEDYDDGCGRRKSSAGEEGRRYQSICGSEEGRIDCFAYTAAERIWRRNCKADKAVEEPVPAPCNRFDLFLPDDILEMCLVRLPLASVMAASLVCKRWRSLTSADRFMQMRREHLKPWLFLFGVVRDGYCSGQIHVLDAALDLWHTIEASILKGRFMFSVAAVGDEVYVVGGCSSLTSFGRMDRDFFKTHKGVMVFSPLTRSWRKVAPMKSARSSPITGVFEVNSGFAISQSRKERNGSRFTRTRVGGVSDVYEDPHRLSLRRQRDDGVSGGSEPLVEHTRNRTKSTRSETTSSNARGKIMFSLIVVGGVGSMNEPLDSAEIYDPISNKWLDIGKVPGDFGIVCSGTVCKGSFYVYSDTDKLAAYHLQKCVWFQIQIAQSPPRLLEYYPKLVSCSGRLFMLSVSWCEQDNYPGWREKAVRKLWELDLKRCAWSEISRHPDAPMDWNAAFVESKGQIFAIEMFKIFGQVLDFLTVCDTSDSRLQWSRVSRKHVAHELDASSCLTKKLAVLHL